MLGIGSTMPPDRRKAQAQTEPAPMTIAEHGPAMSSALSVAAMTAVLKDLLDNRLIEQNIASSVGDVAVTARPPDRITVGADESNQLNVFMYRITPNTGWRQLPTIGDKETDRPPSAPPLALDLHYLLTAYGQQDFVTEILLGCAVQLLHETQVLSRETIQSSLSASSATSGGVAGPLRQSLANSGLVDQVDRISICPEFLSTDETSKLWSALQARYRPSVTYRVSHVMIEASG
jgi:hypothetical protein